MTETPDAVPPDALPRRDRLDADDRPPSRSRAWPPTPPTPRRCAKAGVLHGGNRLQPTATATTVRLADGKTQVLDGPYADTKEQLGGYYLIEAPDLDAALAWAARCPRAGHGIVEVRPVWAM